jgi:hypothetical protein
MWKWLLAATAIVTLVLLTGCQTGTGSTGLGEGRGTLSRGDFDPFGVGRAPVDLYYFTAPRHGRYRITLASGGGEEALHNPQIWVLRGRVRAQRDDFLRAYRQGRGVDYDGSGRAIATVGFPATGGDMFTIAFTSRSNDLGTYNYEISAGGYR